MKAESSTSLEAHITGYFGITNRADMEVIVKMFHAEKMRKGDYFVQAGSRCDRLSFIQSGLTRTYVELDGKEVTQWIGYRDTFITDLASLIFEKPSRWHIQAITDVELLTISRTDYQRLGNAIPQWHVLEKLFIAKCFAMLEDRIFVQLSLSAEERYRLFFEQNRELFAQVPLQYIASMLGMTPETFSRIRRKQIS